MAYTPYALGWLMPGATHPPGHRALAHIDQVLAEKPKKNDYLLSEATQCLAEFRDGLIAAWREHGISPAQRRQLLHVNSVITIVLGIHFPLGEIPWDELDKARAWLAEVVEADEPMASATSGPVASATSGPVA